MEQDKNYYDYNLNKIGERLRSLRESKGLSQEELANKLYKRRSSISDYETGKKLLPTDLLIGYQNYFNVSADYILYGKETIDKESLKKYLHDGIERFINDNF